ncbi:MAG: alanine--tRNA ligase [Flavobacteriales bacterium]|nr:alanine--tRNA ligase [Flavobacteriales bacterium]
MTSKEIRQQFLDFFKSKGHEIVPSAPMVVKGDPTLMFINSGMAPFKNWFLGNEPIKYKRVADTQKCLRVSGKHNDLEEVGVDTYHHTMFEMLGNWSFGDYFKQDAIAWAWELLTDVYKIPKDRLYVTVFEGDEKEKLEFDHEAFDIWKERIAEDRILRGNKKDNFWEMGDTGPCGPCSEIHVDIRSDNERNRVDGKTLVNNDHPQVVEIWNNVFMQFERKANGSLVDLPAKHVDTGMGFERLCMALQHKTSNYDTDVFTPIISEIEKISNKKYERSAEKRDVAMRVIADHVRAVSFAICDGQLPSSGGAGYVIRRILRRAIRYGYSFLGMKEPFIYQLVKVLAEEMGDYFPEIRNNKTLVEKVIREEEESFLRTLDKGIQQLDEIIKKTSADVIDGKTVFELYDTFGFPVDLTALIAAEGKKRIDQLGFDAELLKQKERSRAATKLETEDWVALATGETKFVGYDSLESESKILRFRKVKAKGKEFFQIVLDITPFYAESGGQVGDAGKLISANESIEVVDTKKESGLIVHITEQLPENVNATFRAIVDKDRRTEITSNHTATHLMHEALREVLGTHVEQKGSLVHPDYLRFDFSHFSKMNDDEVERVEQLVNERIRKNFLLDETREMKIEDAKKTGAMMLFGEKYGDLVRLIKFGNSIELCGGTHVNSTSEIGLFRIQSEGAVAAGVRRIEAISNNGAFNFIKNELNTLEEIRQVLKTKDILKSLNDLQTKNAELQKQIEGFNKEKAQVVKKELMGKFSQVNGVNFLAEHVQLESAELKDVAFQLKSEIQNMFAVFASEGGGKAILTCVISEDLVKGKNLNASNIIRELAKEINGGGGGQAFFATAGGTDASGLERALKKAVMYLN